MEKNCQVVTYTPVIYRIDNRKTGEIKEFYLNELEALVKGKMELSQEDKDIIAECVLTSLWNEGFKNLQKYNEGLADGSVMPVSKLILSRKDI